MAAEEISEIIDRGRNILGLQKLLINKKNEIKNSLDNEIKEIKKHCSDCNVGYCAGTAIAGAGTVITATGTRLGIAAIAIGVPIMAAGQLISYATDCADETMSRSFIKKTMDTVASQENLAENLKKELDDFQQFLKTTQSSQSKVMQEKTGLNLEKRFGSQQSSLVQSHSDICGSPSTDICRRPSTDIDFIDTAKAVKDLVDTLNKQTSENLQLNIKDVLNIIVAVKEIVNFILGWKAVHPTEVAILEIRERLVESTKTLKRLSKDLEENVSNPSKAFKMCKSIAATKDILYTKKLSFDNVHTDEFRCTN